MASSTIKSPYTPIRHYTVQKQSNEQNYIYSGINPEQNVLLSAYESAGGNGVVVNIGRSGNNLVAYFYYADGTPYNGACSITFYYIPLN